MPMTARRAIGALVAILLLVSCATVPPQPRLQIPEPRLSPASFGATVSLAQRLGFERANALPDEPARSIDAQLEIDPAQLRMAAVAMGTRILGLRWDGNTLDVQRHPQLPAQVDPARVLRDIQYAYWPTAAVRAGLPAGWTLDDAGAQRELRHDGQPVLSIRYHAAPRWAGNAELDNRVEGYRLLIESSVQDATPP